MHEGAGHKGRPALDPRRSHEQVFNSSQTSAADRQTVWTDPRRARPSCDAALRKELQGPGGPRATCSKWGGGGMSG